MQEIYVIYMNRYKSILNRNTFLIFLFEIGFGLKYNIVGEISISELFLLFYVPLILHKINWTKANIIRKITIIYCLLLFSQVVSEFFESNGLASSLKGIAITIVSYFHFIFLLYYLTKDKRIIFILIISQIASRFFWGSTFEEQSAENVLQGEGATFLKFYLAPLITLISLSLSILYYKKNFSMIFIVLGLSFVVLGARSIGLMVFTTGIISYFVKKRYIFRRKCKIISISLIIIAISYCLYVLYVNQVLSGKIQSGNSIQLLMCNNPYNPFELLLMGRREVWVGWQAFMDKFLLGHGAWPYDSTGYYQRLMYEIGGNIDRLTKDRISYHFLIPSHSVIVGAGMMNGIFAFIFTLNIIVYFFRTGIKTIRICDRKYLLVLIYYIIDMTWNSLFSPQSHFRQTLPIAFSIILIIHIISINNKKLLSR